MATKEELIRNADYILVVNKEFEIVYNSRFDARMGNDPGKKGYETCFKCIRPLQKTPAPSQEPCPQER